MSTQAEWAGSDATPCMDCRLQFETEQASEAHYALTGHQMGWPLGVDWEQWAVSTVATGCVEAALPPRPVTVEATVMAGLPAFFVDGAPDLSARELRERVRAGLLNAGYEFPTCRVTVSVEPLPERTEWNRYGDVLTYWIACAVLAATGQAPHHTPAVAATLSIGGVVTLPDGERCGLRDLIEREAESSTGSVKR